MKILKYAFLLIIGVFFISISFHTCVSKQVASAMEVATNSCPDSMVWLSKTPVPEPNYANFPCGYTVGADGSVTNRAFHEISWQYFLWLTEKVKIGGKTMLRFESMYNDASINLGAGDPAAKTHILGGIEQAGSNSILVDNNGRAVYTSMMINDTYRDFVVNNKLNTKEGLIGFPDTTDFKTGAMSMKASWKIIQKGQLPPKGAYTRTATVYEVVEIDGRITTSDNFKDVAKQTTRVETVALVGFHIAVVIKDHPEFLWATFEHNDNAPNYYLANNTIGIPSQNNYTFYTKGTTKSNANISNYQALKVDPVTQKLSGFYGVSAITQAYRMFQHGGGSSTNQTNIANLNTQVHDSISPNSIWQNYSEVGAVWFNIDNGHLVPNWSLTVNPALQTGSKTLSNATIETFTQDVNQQNSCFSCHNTMKYTPPNGIGISGKNVLTSHILLKNFANTNSKGDSKIIVDRKE